MKPITAEWIAKAEEDYAIAALARKSKRALNNAICFHCQQCAEKYLKARLVEAGIFFPKTHDLAELLDLVIPIEPLWEPFRQSLDQLTSYAVELRYPGDDASNEQVKRALANCRVIRRRVRASLGLPTVRHKARAGRKPKKK